MICEKGYKEVAPPKWAIELKKYLEEYFSELLSYGKEEYE